MAFTQEGWENLLPHWKLRDQIVWLEDGRAEAGFEVFLKPDQLRTESERAQMFRMAESMLRVAVPEGQRLRLIFETTPLDQAILEQYRRELSLQDQPILALLAQERLRMYQSRIPEGRMLSMRCFVTLTGGQTSKATGTTVLSYAMGQMGLLGNAKHTMLTPEEYAQKSATMNQAMARMASYLTAMGLQPKRLDDQELYGLAFRFLNPDLNRVPVYSETWQQYPSDQVRRVKGLASPSLRNQLAKTVLDNRSPSHLRLGETYLRFVQMNACPDSSDWHMLNHLLVSPQIGHLVVDLEHDVQARASVALRLKVQNLYVDMNEQGFKDSTLQQAADHAFAAQKSLTENKAHAYKVGVTLVLRDRSLERLQEKIDEVVSNTSTVGANVFRPLSHGLVEPFKQVIPLAGRSADFKVDMGDFQAANFLLLNGPWVNRLDRPKELHLTRWDTLTAMDPMSPHTLSGHGLVLGANRSGKSFLVGDNITQILSRANTRVIIVDKGKSYARLSHFLGGAYIPTDPDAGVSINIFDLRRGQLEPTDADKARVINVLKVMLNLDPADPNADIYETLIQENLGNLYLNAVQPDPQTRHKRLVTPTLSDFVDLLRRLNAVQGKQVTPELKAMIEMMALRLSKWTGDTPKGKFLDRQTNIPLEDNRLTYYDISGLDQYQDDQFTSLVILLILSSIWGAVEQSQKKVEIHIRMDECDAVLRYAAGIAMVDDLLKRLAKHFGGLWLITQQLEDAVKSGLTGLGNISNYFFLNLGDRADLVGQALGLPPAMTEEIKTLEKVEGQYSEAMVYIKRNDGTFEGDVIRVTSSRLAYYLTNTNPRVVQQIDATLAKHGGDEAAAFAELAGLEARQLWHA